MLIVKVWLKQAGKWSRHKGTIPLQILCLSYSAPHGLCNGRADLTGNIFLCGNSCQLNSHVAGALWTWQPRTSLQQQFEAVATLEVTARTGVVGSFREDNCQCNTPFSEN